MIQAMISLVIVIAVAVGIGLRPSAGPIELLAVAGLFVLVTFAFTWLSVAFGLVSKSVETASNLPTFLVLLPFLGSGFVPTDSMPTAMRLVRRLPAVHAGNRDPARLLLSRSATTADDHGKAK